VPAWPTGTQLLSQPSRGLGDCVLLPAGGTWPEPRLPSPGGDQALSQCFTMTSSSPTFTAVTPHRLHVRAVLSLLPPTLFLTFES
jgi:hypothetical protein